MSKPSQPRLHGALTALLLGMALLLAQGMGLAHRIAHADGPPQACQHATQADHGQGDGHGAALFDDHDDRNDCRLYDQLQLADALNAAMPVVAALAVDAHVPAGCAGLPALTSPQGYQARAPPLAA